jgi:hypothetical protein
MIESIRKSIIAAYLIKLIMTIKNILQATIAGLTIAAMTAGAAFADDCGCGKCASGCDCVSCSMPKEKTRK